VTERLWRSFLDSRRFNGSHGEDGVEDAFVRTFDTPFGSLFLQGFRFICGFRSLFLSHFAWYRVGNIALGKALEVKSREEHDYLLAFILLLSCVLLGMPWVYPGF